MSSRAFARSCLLAPWVLSACTSVLGIDGDYSLEEVDDGLSSSDGGRADVDPSSGGEATAGVAGGSGGSTAGSGGARPGGAGSGGVKPGGGAPAVGGAAGGGSGGEGAVGCSDGKKLCTVNEEALCVTPDPSVGCGPTGCEQCAPPPGGFGLCEGATCSFGCFDGFVKNGGACEAVPPPDGGNGGGSTGAGGRPNTCRVDADCPRCGPTVGCCALIPSGKCGCNFVWCVASP